MIVASAITRSIVKQAQRTVAVQANRQAKVGKLLRLVLSAATEPVTPDAAHVTACILASWTQDERDDFAAAAGCTSPSPETWAMLVQKVRAL